MIKIERYSVMNFENAIRGMRNAMNSWDKSDSYVTYIENPETENTAPFAFFMGPADLELAQKLIKAGSDHRKFMRQIFVSLDITAPLYWWKEMDQYRIAVTTNSTSTMHKLMSKPFEMSDFSFDRLPGYRNEIKQFRPELDEEMIAREVWVYYDEEYDVSQYGRVKHKFRNHYRLISGSLHEDGYIFVTLHGKQIPLHRIVAKLFHPETYDETLVVNHKDGNKQNNFADNLEWVTQSENAKHSHANNLQPNKVTVYTGKFSLEERAKIKELWDSGVMSKRMIAEKYGVSHTCICDIISDKYRYAERINAYKEIARPLVDLLNELRDEYLRATSEEAKYSIWYSTVQLLPSSYNQMRTCTLNYENLLNIYRARKDHKLDEWHVMCDWIEQLPYSELICFSAQLPKNTLARELFGDRVQEMQEFVKVQVRGVAEDLKRIQSPMQNSLFAKMIAMNETKGDREESE